MSDRAFKILVLTILAIEGLCMASLCLAFLNHIAQ